MANADCPQACERCVHVSSILHAVRSLDADTDIATATATHRSLLTVHARVAMHALHARMQARKVEEFYVARWTRKGVQAPPHPFLLAVNGGVAPFLVSVDKK